MGKGYFLDTNTIIYYLEGVLNPPGKKLVKEAIYNGCHISIISKIELLAWNPPEQSKTDNIKIFLKNASIHSLDDDVADRTVYLRKEYKKIKLPDAIIAATCLTSGLDLITRNFADFSIIKELIVIDPFKLNV
jgi:predicted nucleic acid-binding protein